MRIFKDEGYTQLCLPTSEPGQAALSCNQTTGQPTIQASWFLANGKVFAGIVTPVTSSAGGNATVDKVERVWLTTTAKAGGAAAAGSLSTSKEEPPTADFVLLYTGGPAALAVKGLAGTLTN